MFDVLRLRNSAIIPNGVDFKIFYPMEKSIARLRLGEDMNVKIILFCSNPNRSEKNVKLAKNAMNLINKRNVQLRIIYGIDQKDLLLHYNSADCLLLTSFHEGSPNVVKKLPSLSKTCTRLLIESATKIFSSSSTSKPIGCKN